jgi:phosphoserine phosphatase
MRMVLTLIAGAAGRHALPDLAAAVAGALPGPAETRWLAPGAACDLRFAIADGDTWAGVEAPVRALLGEAAIDLVLQPEAARRKRLLVADLEATVIENEMLDEIAAELGIGPRIGEITRRAMNGEVDFAAALEARVALLAGTDCRVLDAAAARIRPTPGARALVTTMRRDGAATALVSGGFTVFAERVGATLGFDHVVANRLDTKGGRLAGTVQPPYVTAARKRETLLALAARYGLPPAATLAVGDGANDLPMLAAAGLGVAYRAKPSVVATAPARLDHADLTALLHAQGYREDEIAG